MKRWALVTVLLYVAVLLAITVPALMAAFWPMSMQWAVESFAAWWYWAILAGLALLQAALLVVPVRLARGRPVTRRWLLWPILATVLLGAILAGGMLMVVAEGLNMATPFHWREMAAVGGLWVLWGILFGLFAWRRGPETFMSRLVKFLLAGSILELLVAVPTHVYVRARGECCAGLGTMWGLAAGLAILPMAFGPAVFALFVRRYRMLRPFPVILVPPPAEKQA